MNVNYLFKSSSFSTLVYFISYFYVQNFKMILLSPCIELVLDTYRLIFNMLTYLKQEPSKYFRFKI